MVQAIPSSPLPSLWYRDIIIFYIYTGLSLFFGVLGILAARKHGELASVVLLPCLSLALAWDSLSLAVAVTAEEWPSASAAVTDAVNQPDLIATRLSTVVAGVLKVRAAIQPFIIPLFLVTMFELNYEVHKRRNANFFFDFIRFDQGKRSRNSFIGNLVRYSVWLLALVILVLFNLINAPYMTNPELMLETSRFGSKRLAIYTTVDHVINWTDAMDFFPYCVFLAFCFYSGASLWRYGSTISTDVRSTAINPWMSIFLASIGLTLAWVLTPRGWLLPYAVNGMELALLIAVVITLYLVEMNLRTLDAWEATLNAVNEAVMAAMAQSAKVRELQELAKVRSRKGGRRSSSADTVIVKDQRERYRGAPSLQASTTAGLVSVDSNAGPEVLIHQPESDDEAIPSRASSGANTGIARSESSTLVPPSPTLTAVVHPRATSDALVSDEVAQAVHAAAMLTERSDSAADAAGADLSAVAETMQRVTGTPVPKNRGRISLQPTGDNREHHPFPSLGGLLSSRHAAATPEHWVKQEQQWRAKIHEQLGKEQPLTPVTKAEADDAESADSTPQTAVKASVPLWSRTFAEAELEQRIRAAAKAEEQSRAAEATPSNALATQLAGYRAPGVKDALKKNT